MALEYLPNGDLRSYLRKARHVDEDNSQGVLSSKKLIQFALDVAKGMKHLAASGESISFITKCTKMEEHLPFKNNFHRPPLANINDLYKHRQIYGLIAANEGRSIK